MGAAEQIGETLKRFYPIFLAAIGATITFLHLLLLIQRYIPELSFVRTSIGAPAVWRSGVNFLGPNFAEYLVFLNERIPEEAVVVLPPRDFGDRFITHPQIMQFFLSPRTVINCTDLACLQDYLDGQAFILIDNPERFPRTQADALADRLSYMNASWGMITPAGFPAQSPGKLPHFSNIEAFILAFILPGIWFLLVSLPGVFLIRLAFPDWGLPAQVFAGAALSLVSFSLFALFPLLFSLPLTCGLIYTLTGLHLMLATLIGIKFRTRLFLAPVSRSWISWAAVAWQALFLLIGAAAFLIAAGKGYFSTDGIVIWGSKGYGIANLGLYQGIADWGTTAAGYPLALPILIGALKTLFAELLPASKLIFPIFFLALVLTLWETFRTRISATWAAVSTFIIAFAPALTEHAVIAYANLPFTAMLTLGILLSIPAPHTHISRRGQALLAGLTLVLAAWIRPEGIYLVLAFLLIAALLPRRPTADSHPLPWVYLALPVAAYLILWSLLSPALYPPDANPSYLAAALARISSGELRLDAAWTIFLALFMLLFTRTEWGYLGFALLAAAPFILTIRKPLRLPAAHLLLSGLAFLLLTAGLTYLVSLADQPGCDLGCWINTGLNRYAIPGYVLTASGLFMHILDLLPARLPKGTRSHV
jgi:hypothetical protein